MIAAACPACGSPLTFAHAASLSAVCGACDAVVIRQDVDYRSIGKVAPFIRELSPLQVGVTGVADGRPFRVAGGLRRQRPGVRWNEWYLAFEDGGVGWLGEGNGQLQLFVRPAYPLPTLRHPPAVGERLLAEGESWVVSESSAAAITGAVGELPFVPALGAPTPYADLRGPQGLVGTIDGGHGEALLYRGVGVDILDLKLEGLRPFAGWSDPVLVNFAGPEVEGQIALDCPACGRSVPLRAIGAAAQVTCPSCSSTLSVSDEGLDRLVQAARSQPRRFSLPLGARGTLDGVLWEVIGLIERFVVEEGERYTWWEFLLHNPYRGFRWLVEDPNRHWSLVTLLVSPPRRSSSSEAEEGGRTYEVFNRGKVTISYVIGELTWEAAKGDVVDTIDYVCSPYMLSREKSGDEITWARGQYLDVNLVRQAFTISLVEPVGVGPHQPNPWSSPAVVSGFQRAAALVAGLAVGLWAVAAVTGSGAVVATAQGTVGSADSDVVSGPFVVPDSLNNAVRIDFHANTPLTFSLIETTTGGLVEATDWSSIGDIVLRPPAGTYTLRLSRAEGEGAPAPAEAAVVVRPRDWAPGFLVLAWAVVGPFLRMIAASGFEQRRWQNAGVRHGDG